MERRGETMTFKLRYYAPIERNVPFQHKERYAEVIKILELIKSKHGIDYEVFGIRSEVISGNRYVDEKHEKEIYETHFKPRARILNKRIGAPLPKCLRSRGGRGHYYIAGVVAVLRNGLVEWFTCYESCRDRFKMYDEDLNIGFLKAVLDVGLPLLEDLCKPLEPSQKKSEAELIEKFIKSDILKGKFCLEVKVGSQVSGPFDYRKSIDLLCHGEKETWVIEAKERLNYEALGEVITYAHLYAKEHPSEEIRMGIICSELDEEILETCKFYGITVFKLNEEGFKKY
jgi:hypothetical protein